MAGTDQTAVLREFAVEKKKRIQPCEIYDSNVCSSTFDDGTGWRPRISSGYAFTLEIRMSVRGRRVHVAASPEYMCLKVEGRLDVGLLSINKPNRILFVDVPCNLGVCGDLRWPLFLARHRELPARALELLELPSFHSAISQLIKSPEDSVHICKDSILAYFYPASPESLQRAIESFCGFVGARTSISARSLSTLPYCLTPLIPVIKKWAEGDDGWRAEMLARARKSDIEDLVATVEPLLGQINKYLDASNDEAACALGRLAELVAEARMDLHKQES
jgi:hypothetical protein